MGTLNLREMPDDLLRKVKAKAALSGMTLRDYVTTVLEKAVEQEEPTLKVRRSTVRRK